MSGAITTVEALEALYGKPAAPSLVKVARALTPHYRALIEASPFCVLASVGTSGLDCSPRGDAPENGLSGLVRIVDDTTLILPDRRGNNRIDTLRNIVHDPRVALLFLIPGSGTTLRLNGKAVISADPDLLESFAVGQQKPRSALIISLDEVYFQCARAVVRAGLWDLQTHTDPKSLPTPGQILADQSDGDVGGKAYDQAWPERAAKTMW